MNNHTKSVLDEFASNINPFVDLCDDFYDYACGSFASRHPVPKGRDEVSYFSLELDKILAYTFAQDRVNVPSKHIPEFSQIFQFQSSIKDESQRQIFLHVKW